MDALIIYLAAINIIAFVTMAIDKYKAQRHEWRISEASIFTIAIIGGAVGVLLGMNFFHHKTKHLKFTVGVPLVVLMNIALLWYILR